jgi:hypothetical protein
MMTGSVLLGESISCLVTIDMLRELISQHRNSLASNILYECFESIVTALNQHSNQQRLRGSNIHQAHIILLFLSYSHSHSHSHSLSLF